MKLTLLLFPILILPMALQAQTNPYENISLRFGSNYRLYPSNVTQTEVFIVKSPANQDVLFSSCNTLTFIPFFISEGIFVTTDGGESWQGNDTCTGEPITFHGGDPGIAIDNQGRFILTRLGRSPFVGLYSHYSADQGQTWSAQQVISTDDLERATLATDAIPQSPYVDRTYAAWVKFALPFPLMFSYTDDGAQSWSAPQQINDPPNRSAGGDLAIGPDGSVNVCWAGVTETSPFKEIYVGFASSTTGGSTWNVSENAYPVNGITGILPNKDNIRVNGLPSIAVDDTDGPRRGWIYIVTGQKDLPPAGTDPDVILNRSADGGLTWSAGIRVNQDPVNDGKDQYFPTVHIDRFGAVNVIFYDDRNTTTDSTGVFLARSSDGGDTWKEYELSDHNFKPTPIGGLGQGYQGDNIDITSTDSTLWPVWMDNSTGIYQIWTTPVKFSAIQAVSDPDQNGLDLKLYPNPATGNLKLEIRNSKSGYVSLNVYDLLGTEVSTLYHGKLKPGDHIFNLDPEKANDGKGLAPGMYLCRLTVNGTCVTKRIIYLK